MTGTPRNGLPRRLAVAATAMSALTACTGNAGPEPVPAGSSPSDTPPPVIETELEMTVVEEDPDRQRSAFPGEPLLDIESAELSEESMESVYATAFADESLVLFGGDRFGGNHLVVLDIATGRMQWQLHGRDDLPGEDQIAWGSNSELDFDEPVVLRGAEGWLVLLQYTSLYVNGADAAHEEGVAALSAADGSVVWTAKLVDVPAGDERPPGVEGVSVSGDTAIVAIGNPRNGVADDPGDEGPVFYAGYRTVALNGDDGSLRWEAPAKSPMAAAGDVAYVVEADPPPYGHPNPVTALDASTGETLWESTMYGAHPILALAADDVALLQMYPDSLPDTAIERSVLVEPRTGELLAAVNAKVDCAHGGATRTACAFIEPGTEPPEIQLFTLDAAQRHIGVAANRLPGEYLGPVAMLSSWIFMDAEAGIEVVDSAGRELLHTEPHDVPVAVSDQYVAVAPTIAEYSTRKFTVYALE